jgi:hypothetical protein
MHTIKQSSGAVIASDTQASVSALDNAVLAQARLCASIIETAGESKLPVAATQKLLQTMTSGISGLVASRSDIVTAVREINLLQSKSNLKTTSFGCPEGPPALTGMIEAYDELMPAQ